jgi:16S rRNA (cytosine967-C5)-methyltransferase
LQKVIVQGLSIHQAIEQLAIKPKTNSDLSFIKACIYGVLRNYFSLEKTLCSLLNRPLRTKDTDIKMLLISAIYQAKYMNVPDHAVSSVNIEAARYMNKKWACGLVNAVTRKFLRSELAVSETDSFEHPIWLVDVIKDDWPSKWEMILCENNNHPPMTIRVNTRTSNRLHYLETLRSHGIEARPTRYSKEGCTIVKPINVTTLPHYEDGHFIVQDEAAQLAIELIDIKNTHNVLDACAAPGGKTTHLLEYLDGGQITAIDSGKKRLKRLKDNLTRLNMNCRILHDDAIKPSSWWNGELYDRILVDAPCSATGVIRRHPDIRFHRELDNLESLISIQRSLLKNLWPLLKVGGKLLYVTCSIMSIENDRSVETLLKTNNNIELDNIKISCGVQTEYGVQILPGESNMDGFYFSLLKKNENTNL